MAEKKNTEETTDETAPLEETTPEAPAADAAPEPAETAEPEAAAEEPVAEGEGPAEIEGEVAAAEAGADAVDEPVVESDSAAEPDAAAEPEAAATEAPAAEPAPAPKTKSNRHVPRAERHKHSKPKREKPAERKPIVRGEKPQRELGRRQERRGVVVSASMDKTIVVQVELIKIHPKYKKVIRRSRKFHAHDEGNQAHVGDVVRIVETRPLSKTKTWRLAEVVEVAK